MALEASIEYKGIPVPKAYIEIDSCFINKEDTTVDISIYYDKDNKENNNKLTSKRIVLNEFSLELVTDALTVHLKENYYPDAVDV